ncbi:MAG: translocation/assembly module TamB domain-containing protein [Cyanobacteria bacterium J06598_1]
MPTNPPSERPSDPSSGDSADNTSENPQPIEPERLEPESLEPENLGLNAEENLSTGAAASPSDDTRLEIGERAENEDALVPHAESSSETPAKSFPWFWLGTFVGTLISGIGIGALIWGWMFVQDDLSPLVARLLTDYLGRPVVLGEVEEVWFGGVSVGPSFVEASEEDSTTLTTEQIIVKVDLIETLLTSKLGLDLTVVDAEIYLAQDPERGWLNLVLPEREPKEAPDPLEISVDDVRLQDSVLTLVPLPPEGSEPDPIFLEQVKGTLSTEKVAVAGKEPLLTRFEVIGEPVEGGEVTLRGEVTPVEAIASPQKEAVEDRDEATDDALDSDEPARDEPAPDDSEPKVAFATNLFVQADEAPISNILDFTLSSINLPTNEVTVESGVVSGILDMAFRPDEPIDYAGTISARDADIVATVLPLPVENAAGEAQFQGGKWTVDRLSGDYGEIKDVVAEGLIDFDDDYYDLAAAKNGISVEAFSNTVDLELPVPTEGTFDAVAKMTGPIANPLFSGNATADGPVLVDKLTFTSASSDFLLQGQQLYLDNIAAIPSTGGSLTGNGQVRLAQGSPFTFQLAGRSLPVREIGALYGLKSNFPLGLGSADATVVGRNGNVTTAVDWATPNAQYPGTGTVNISNGTDLAFSNTTFAIGGGTVSGGGRLIDGIWDSDVAFQNVQLGAFSADLLGSIDGQFQVSGTTADTRIGAIAANGNITFSDGLASFSPQFDTLNSPLSAQVAWNGEKIQVIQATSNRLTANGTLTPEFDEGFTGLDSFDLNVTAQDYALAELPFPVPDVLQLSGRTNAAGRLTGSPTAPNFSGDLQLANLVVNSVPFSEQMAGTVDYTTAGGLALNVVGGRDRIALSAGPFDTTTDAIPPFDFDVGWRGGVATGRTQGDLLTVSAQNFPLAALNFPADGFADVGQLRGTLTDADVVANLAEATLEGDVAIDQLGVGYIGAGQLAGRIRYANDLATFTGGELRLSDNLYTVTGSLSLAGSAPVYSANIDTQKGNVQDLLTALSIYKLEDFRRGLTPPDWLDDPLAQVDLNTLFATTAAGASTQLALDDQLNRLAELDELQADREVVEAAQPLPPLRELKGPFAGDFQLDGTGGDFQLAFDIAGRQWQWGEDYRAEDMVAKGTLTPDTLTLAPVRFSSDIEVAAEASTASESATVEEISEEVVAKEVADDGVPIVVTDTSTEPASTEPASTESESASQPTEAFVNLAGQLVFGRDTELTSDLQATVQNVDIAAIDDILELPLDVAGRANGRATLGGTLANPQLRGNGALTAAAINETPIDTATAEFLYRNARLLLTSSLTTANNSEEPLRLSAQIPYAFNFMDTQPDTEDIEIDINVRDEGLALLNIFSRQVAWESGEGQVNLRVGGTLSNIEIEGQADVSNAVVSAKVLPEPLTNVNGSALFVNDQIVVESLQGQFSDGQLTAAGIFPLRESLIKGVELASGVPDSVAQPVVLPELLEDMTPPDTSVVETPKVSVPAIELSAEPVDAPVPTDPVNPLFPLPLAANLPLTANLENIDLELEDLYSGGVNGQIIVGGNALVEGPQIGGRVILSNGRVLLSSDSEVAIDSETGLPVEEPEETGSVLTFAGIENPEEGGIEPIFRNLELTLGDSIRIVQGNLLNFVADGTLKLTGPADALEPDGTINIRSGRVSLFTQSFRLRGSDNTAEFTPEMGLANPFLDVSLRASVPEVNSAGPVASTPFIEAEIADESDLGFENTSSLRTIRVRANVVGPANAIFENLELSSSPPRSESELIALIGGGFVSALESTVGSLSGGGDDFSGLINLVGGALLDNVQDFVGDALSLSEFRLFPVTSATRARSEESRGTGLDIGAEAGFDLTEDASLSIGKILTDSSNPEFGVNYRLTPSLTIRSNTNLNDINQVLLEYEIRF